MSIFVSFAFGFCLFGVFIIGLGFLVGWLVHCFGFFVINFWLSKKHVSLHTGVLSIPWFFWTTISLCFSWSLCLHLSSHPISEALISWRMIVLLSDKTFLEPDGDSVIVEKTLWATKDAGTTFQLDGSVVSLTLEAWKHQLLSLKSGKKVQEIDLKPFRCQVLFPVSF